MSSKMAMIIGDGKIQQKQQESGWPVHTRFEGHRPLQATML